eukprot:364769-Chlamydomonas_euryale.AAC.6
MQQGMLPPHRPHTCSCRAPAVLRVRVTSKGKSSATHCSDSTPAGLGVASQSKRKSYATHLLMQHASGVECF